MLEVSDTKPATSPPSDSGTIEFDGKTFKVLKDAEGSVRFEQDSFIAALDVDQVTLNQEDKEFKYNPRF